MKVTLGPKENHKVLLLLLLQAVYLIKINRLIQKFSILTHTYKLAATTVVSPVSAHGHLSIPHDFGPHGRLPGI